jgi:nucleoside-diphosphate-sugar epimerase
MRILLVGGNSALARAVAPKLGAFSELMTAGRSGCDFELDLSWSAECIELPDNLDWVINFSAQFGGIEFADLLAVEEVNVLGSLKLAHACSRAQVGNFLQVSSILGQLTKESPFYSPYAISKRHAEELLDYYCTKREVALTVLRPSRIYGEGDSFRKHQPFLYDVLDKVQRGDHIVLHGENDSLRNFIHVDDVSEVITRVIGQGVEGFYDCANLSNIRLSEIVSFAIEAFGSNSEVSFDEAKPDIPDNAFECDDTLYDLIDFHPKITIQEGFRREALLRNLAAG